jgi:hypothetical protein
MKNRGKKLHIRKSPQRRPWVCLFFSLCAMVVARQFKLPGNAHHQVQREKSSTVISGNAHHQVQREKSSTLNDAGGANTSSGRQKELKSVVWEVVATADKHADVREVVATADKHADVLVKAFTARNKALDAIRDFRKEPVRFYRPDGINMARTRDCDVPCEEIRREAATRYGGKPVLYVEKYTIARTLESGINYPPFQYETLRRNKAVDIISTFSLRGMVPSVYGSWRLFNITEQIYLKELHRENAAVAFVSNCNMKFRIDAMAKLRELGVPVDNYGKCGRTHHETQTPGVSKQASKASTLRKYKFCLAFENSIEEDYVTEKLWQCLAHGGLTVLIGPPNARDYYPAGEDSMLYIPSMDEVPNVASRIRAMMDDDDLYMKAMSWKVGPLKHRCCSHPCNATKTCGILLNYAGGAQVTYQSSHHKHEGRLKRKRKGCEQIPCTDPLTHTSATAGDGAAT